MNEGRENLIGTTSTSSLLHLDHVPSDGMRRERLSYAFGTYSP